MNKKARANIPLKPKAPFKWVFMDIITSTAPKSLTSDTTFSNYLLIVDAYSNIPKLYGMDKITFHDVREIGRASLASLFFMTLAFNRS